MTRQACLVIAGVVVLGLAWVEFTYQIGAMR